MSTAPSQLVACAAWQLRCRPAGRAVAARRLGSVRADTTCFRQRTARPRHRQQRPPAQRPCCGRYGCCRRRRVLKCDSARMGRYLFFLSFSSARMGRQGGHRSHTAARRLPGPLPCSRQGARHAARLRQQAAARPKGSLALAPPRPALARSREAPSARLRARQASSDTRQLLGAAAADEAVAVPVLSSVRVAGGCAAGGRGPCDQNSSLRGAAHTDHARRPSGSNASGPPCLYAEPAPRVQMSGRGKGGKGLGKGGARRYIEWLPLFSDHKDSAPVPVVDNGGRGATLAGAVETGEAGKVLKVLDRCV